MSAVAGYSVSEAIWRQAFDALAAAVPDFVAVAKPLLTGFAACVDKLIDLHAMSRVLYRAIGPQLKQAFQDGTHHNAYGSYELAKCVIEGIRQDQLPLAKFIVNDVPPFEPGRPDSLATFDIPASASESPVKPDGS